MVPPSGFGVPLTPNQLIDQHDNRGVTARIGLHAGISTSITRRGAWHGAHVTDELQHTVQHGTRLEVMNIGECVDRFQSIRKRSEFFAIGCGVKRKQDANHKQPSSTCLHEVLVTQLRRPADEVYGSAVVERHGNHDGPFGLQGFDQLLFGRSVCKVHAAGYIHTLDGQAAGHQCLQERALATARSGDGKPNGGAWG